MAELKPCPFCGGDKIQFRIEGHFNPWTKAGMCLWYSCACYDCGGALNNGSCTDMTKAARAWNERAGNTNG